MHAVTSSGQRSRWRDIDQRFIASVGGSASQPLVGRDLCSALFEDEMGTPPPDVRGAEEEEFSGSGDSGSPFDA